MGIADLWPILSSESDERVAFPVFLTRFLEANGRFPTLAIDAYMFMFWSQLPGAENDVNVHRRILRNFMAKLWYLVQHNVLFVVVFDGKYKPGKLRNGHIPDIPGAVSYDEMLGYFKKMLPSTYSENLSLVDTLKLILQRNCIDYVQAPGEAEAECAWLQRLGVVDFVVSDDSDTLVFGASQMLRLFNRVKYKNENGEDVLSSSGYYVNPVYMDRIVERTGLDKDRLVLVAVLRGGDYSTGALNIGITRASEIALCGSTMLLHSPRKAMQDFGAMPDFTRMLTETFVEMEKRHAVLPDPYYSLKSELDRNDSLAAFNEFLASYLRQNAKKVFGRMVNLMGHLAVDDYYALLYFFPLVNSKVFKFTPYSTSFSSLKPDDLDLWKVNVDSSVARYNFVCDSTDIGRLVISGNAHTFIGKGRGTQLAKESFALPRERKYNLKSFALKLLVERKYAEHIKLVRTKMLDGVELAVLQFQRQQLNEAVYLTKQAKIEPENEDDQEIDPNDPNSLVIDAEEDDTSVSVVVTMAAVRLLAPNVVEEFERVRRVKRSPRKKPSPQKTTLDLIWTGLLPTRNTERQNLKPEERRFQKNTRATSPSPLRSSSVKNSPLKNPLLKHSPLKNSPAKVSPVKGENNRTRRSRHVPLPGQSMVTSFFQPRQELDPFQDAIFVPSDEEEVKTSDYMSMRNIMANGPSLSIGLSKTDSNSRVSSRELSPSKRIRRELALSPDNSPLKSRRESSGEFPPGDH